LSLKIINFHKIILTKKGVIKREFDISKNKWYLNISCLCYCEVGTTVAICLLIVRLPHFTWKK